MQTSRGKVILFGFLAFLLFAGAAQAQKDDVYRGYFENIRQRCSRDGKQIIAIVTGGFSASTRVDSAVQASCQCIIDKAQARYPGVVELNAALEKNKMRPSLEAFAQECKAPAEYLGFIKADADPTSESVEDFPLIVPEAEQEALIYDSGSPR